MVVLGDFPSPSPAMSTRRDAAVTNPHPRRGEFYLSAEQLAVVLGVSGKTVRNWIRQGKITPSYKTLGGHYRFGNDEVRKIRREMRGEDT